MGRSQDPHPIIISSDGAKNKKPKQGKKKVKNKIKNPKRKNESESARPLWSLVSFVVRSKRRKKGKRSVGVIPAAEAHTQQQMSTVAMCGIIASTHSTA